MRRNWILSLVSVVAGLALLVTVYNTLSGAGSYYGFTGVELTSPGLLEIGLLGAGVTAVGTVFAGAFSFDAPHPAINLGSAAVCGSLLAAPHVPGYGETVWAFAGIGGVLVAGNGAMFVLFVEWKRHVRRVKRMGSRGSAGS